MYTASDFGIIPTGVATELLWLRSCIYVINQLFSNDVAIMLWVARWPARWPASRTMHSHLLVVSGLSSCWPFGRSEAEMNPAETTTTTAERSGDSKLQLVNYKGNLVTTSQWMHVM